MDMVGVRVDPEVRDPLTRSPEDRRRPGLAVEDTVRHLELPVLIGRPTRQRLHDGHGPMNVLSVTVTVLTR